MLILPDRRIRRWRRIKRPRAQFSTWDIGGTNCCSCAPCPLPPSFTASVSINQGGGVASGSGTLPSTGALFGYNCSWNGTAAGTPATTFPLVGPGAAPSAGIAVYCKPNCTLILLHAGGGAGVQYFYNNPANCAPQGGMNPLTLSVGSVCSPLNVTFTGAFSFSMTWTP